MEATLRKNWIDWAKALGILLVVMGHSNYSQPDINPMIFMGLLVQFVAAGVVTVAVIAGCMCVEWLFHNNKYLSKIL